VLRFTWSTKQSDLGYRYIPGGHHNRRHYTSANSYRGLISQQTSCCNRTTNTNRADSLRPLAKLAWFGNDSVQSPNPSRTVVYAECIRLTCSPHIACHSFPTLVIHFIPFSLKAVSSQYKGIRLHFGGSAIKGERQLQHLTSASAL
jgi:hypothetical protein